MRASLAGKREWGAGGEIRNSALTHSGRHKIVVNSVAWYDGEMEPSPYLVVFDFMEQSAPSIAPLVGTLAVGGVGIVLAIWGTQIAARILGGAMAIFMISIGVTDLLGATSSYNETRADIVAERTRIVEGVFGANEDGSFTIGSDKFELPRRPGARHVYSFSPAQAERLEGMYAQARFATNGQLASLRVCREGNDGCGASNR